jgi:hypothetical protein
METSSLTLLLALLLALLRFRDGVPESPGGREQDRERTMISETLTVWRVIFSKPGESDSQPDGNGVKSK